MKIRSLHKKFVKKFRAGILLLIVVFCCYYLSVRYISANSLLLVFTNERNNYLNRSSGGGGGGDRWWLRDGYDDIDSLKLLYSSDVCVYVKPKIVLLVTSHVSNVDIRNIIRRSRPLDLFDKFDAQLVFLIAVRSTAGADHQRRVTEKEFRKYGDLIQGEFVEAYRNLTWKHLMGLRWVRDRCKTASYVVKMDDDIVVNYYKLFEILTWFRKANFDLLGHAIAHMKPIRDIASKWHVSEDEYSSDEYPTFLSGWLYIVKRKAATSIINVSKSVPYFWIDDVFVSGILREKANLTLTDISNHFRYDPKNIECCIINKYSCDFLAAPNGKNAILHLKLSNHLWECRYKKPCAMESSFKRSCWFTSIGGAGGSSSTNQSRAIIRQIDTASRVSQARYR